MLWDATSDKDVVSTTHTIETHYVSMFRIFSRGILPQRKIKKMLAGSDDDFQHSFTAQDEALLLVILDNNHYKWKAEFQLKLNKASNNLEAAKSTKLTSEEKKTLPQSKYTMATSETRSSNLRGRWDDQGFGTFVNILGNVAKFRTTDEFRSFKKAAMDNYDQDKVRLAKRRKTQNESIGLAANKDDTFAAMCDEYFNNYCVGL